MQQREGFGRGSYKGKKRQVIWRTGGQNQKGEYQNKGNQYRETKTRPGPIAVDEEAKREEY